MSDDVEHSHCESCYRIKCTVTTDPPCAIISCNNFCGAAFHECKASEHRELCQREKVPCINVGNGCPMVLLRRDVRQHLSVCPASVICCTMEWCRWPMYSREHGTSVPFAASSPRARCGQLDVALALRDQRTLDRARKFPRRSLVRTLRNRFTKRHPTVPLVVGGSPTFVGEGDNGNSGDLEFSESEDEDKEANSRAPWLTSEPPGLKKSILSELFGELSTKSPAPGNISNLEAEDIHCALCSKPRSKDLADASLCPPATSDAVSQSFTCSVSENKDVSLVRTEMHQPETENASDLFSESCTTSQKAGLSPSAVSNQVPDSISKMTVHDGHIHKTDETKDSGRQPVNKAIGDTKRSESPMELPEDPGGDPSAQSGMRERGPANENSRNIGHSDPADRSDGIGEAETGQNVEEPMLDSDCCDVDDRLPSAKQSPERPPPALHEVLAVDLDMAVCTRGNIRDPSVYSFTCAQLFRRDEYARHVRDVHSVVHDALEHFLEVRCPLAHRGCTFSMHRRRPTGADVIFSPLLESIGLTRTDSSTANKSTLSADTERVQKCCLKLLYSSI